jgi:hypothetical protein
MKLHEHERQRILSDSNNVKRRVYDVLNVLVAMGILEKDKKRLTYVGEPTPNSSSSLSGPHPPSTPATSAATTTTSPSGRNRVTSDTQQQAEEANELFDHGLDSLTERVNSKRSELSGLLVHHLLLHELIKQNETKGQPGEAVSDGGDKLKLPFIVISSSPDCHVDIQISEDKSGMLATFDSPFELNDDVEVLTRMNLLEKITEESILSVVPTDLLDLLPAFLKAKLTNHPPSGENTTSTRTKTSNGTGVVEESRIESGSKSKKAKVEDEADEASSEDEGEGEDETRLTD